MAYQHPIGVKFGHHVDYQRGTTYSYDGVFAVYAWTWLPKSTCSPVNPVRCYVAGNFTSVADAVAAHPETLPNTRADLLELTPLPE
jgi:hypothetical protein